MDFTGGLVVTIPNPAGADVEEVREAIDPVGASDARIQLVDGGDSVRIQTSFMDDPAPIEAASQVTGAEPGEANVESVGPTFGAQIAQRALIALVVFIGAVILYIGWRLEFKMGVTAIAALLHDLIVTVGIYALFGIDVTPATVVSILTILGYSLYDSVVVFDQIKENERAAPPCHLLGHREHLHEPGTDAVDQYSAHQPHSHRHPPHGRGCHPRGNAAQRLLAGSVHRDRRRHLLIDRGCRTAAGSVEGRRGELDQDPPPPRAEGIRRPCRSDRRHTRPARAADGTPSGGDRCHAPSSPQEEALRLH